MNLKAALSAERAKNEMFRDFLDRRVAANAFIKVQSRGKIAHQSVHFTTAKPDDPVVKELILRGKARKFGTTFVKGEELDIIRHKGTTYRRPEPKAPSKRDKHRRKGCT